MAEKKCYMLISSYIVNVDDLCMACKLGKHPLGACKRFKALPHKQMIAVSTCKQMGLPELPQAWPFFKAVSINSEVFEALPKHSIRTFYLGQSTYRMPALLTEISICELELYTRYDWQVMDPNTHHNLFDTFCVYILS